MEAIIDQNVKMSIQIEKKICRCCLATDKSVKDISLFSYFYQEMSGIKICSDGIPQWICTECMFLMRKYVNFKHKIIKAYKLLNDYLTRCTPFPMDANDQELQQYKTSELSKTEILLIDNEQNNILGFHSHVEHVKKINSSPLQVGFQFPSAPKEEIIKEEKNEILSDFEDDIPLEEYRKNTEPPNEISNLKVKHSKKTKMKTPAVLQRKKINKTETKRNLSKVKGRRRVFELDPEKIRAITLTLEEQMEIRKKLSVDEEYLKYPYRCELCYLGFNHETKLENHMKKHTPARGKFHCTLCKMYLPTIYSYKVHESSHTTRYECVKCGRVLVSRMNMLRHYSSEHEGIINQYTCKICGKKSHNYSTHTGHIRRHHKNNGIRPKCDQCGKTFITNASLIDHMQIHKGVKNFKCDICGDRFRTKSQVKFHKYKHVTTKEFYCVECDVRFKSERNLRLHLLKSVKHQDKSSLLKYPCTRCPASFMSPRVLQDHISYQHDGLRLYQCDHCGREFASANTLSKHVRKKHAGAAAIDTHKCDQCEQIYNKKTDLVDHIRTHAGEKTLECEQCAKIFSHNSTKNAHIKMVHSKHKQSPKVDEDGPDMKESSQ